MAVLYPHLFSPYRIKSTVFRNRICSAPNGTKHKTPEGFPLEFEVTIFESRAKGGAGQVTTGNSGVDIRYRDQAHSRALTFGDPDCQPYLTEVALGIRRHGAVASVQLNHPGPQSQPAHSGGRNPIGPSAFVRPDGVQVDEMTEDDIEQAIEAFAKAAEFGQSCQFNMCMVHGGHGWLIGSFFSKRTNKRTDRWGGSIENRARLALEVVKRIRQRCGDEFLIEFRMSADEFVADGITPDEAIEFARLLEPHIDLLHVSAAGLSTAHHNPDEVNDPAFYQQIWSHCPTPHIMQEQGCYIPYAAEMKRAGIKTPIVSVGAITTLELAEKAIAEGSCDFVAMARAIIADPELPKKGKEGRPEDVRPCIRCEKCNDRHVSRQCTVNPEMGRFVRMLYVDKNPEPKRVAIIGGGPGGMQAAITAGNRGHGVVLFERQYELGGMLRVLRHEYLKREMGPYLEWLVRQTERVADVRLGCEATPEMIEAGRFDSVICAIGAEPVVPDIEGVGLSHVVTAPHIHDEGVELGEKVVIIGASMTACELAYEFARQGRQVELLARRDKLFPERDKVSRNYSMPILASIEADPAVTIRRNTKPGQIRVGGVVAETEQGTLDLACDSVVLACGMRSRIEQVDALWNCAPEFRPVGDCVSPRHILDATREAFFAALDL